MCSYIRDARSVSIQGALVCAYMHETRELGMHVLHVFMCIPVNMRFLLCRCCVCVVCVRYRDIFFIFMRVCVNMYKYTVCAAV